MAFARLVFTAAGLLGLVTLLPLLALEDLAGRLAPPAINHPELYYGFLGLALAWQVGFLIIGRDPARFRPLMPVAVLEKLGFGLPVLVLAALGRVGAPVVLAALPDLALGGLFALAWFRTRPAA